MFGELPKPFDKNFAIGYFLPVGLFMVVSSLLMGYWSRIQAVLTGNLEIDPALVAFDVTLSVFVAWMGGILLLVLNREIVRFLEGYGEHNPLRIFEHSAKNQYKEKRKRLEELDNEFSKPSFTDQQRGERRKLMQELAKTFPDQEALVLPTTFGNALRAFEVYPRVMYGIEGIDGWPRILAVIPKEYRELIDDAKAQVDWWVNLGVVSFALLIEVWVFIFSKWGLSPGWFYTMLNLFIPLGIFCLLNWLFFWRATSAAIGWGEYVKSAFDIYRFNLLELVGIDIPKDREEEKTVWKKYSQAIIYRSPETLPDLKKETTNLTKSNAKKTK